MSKLKNITEEDVKRFFIFLLGVLILSIDYNMFVEPNSFILGGATGISIIIERCFQVPAVYALYALNLFLLIVSLIFIGKDFTKKAIVGSLLYPTLIALVSPICNILLPFFTFDNFLINILVCSCLNGLGYGLIYKMGYNTGGGDIIIKITNKYLELSDGTSSLFVNSLILGFGILAFGIPSIMYSIIILILTSLIMDKIIIGISDCKMFFVYSREHERIKEFIMQELNTGVTLFNTEGGFKQERREMLMIVVPTKDYTLVKDKILKIDNDAFFVVSDCYEVNGGIKRKNLPFI